MKSAMKIFLALAFLAAALPAAAAPRNLGGRTAAPVHEDDGENLAGVDIQIGTSTPVLVSSSAANADRVYRRRGFQNTAGPYHVFLATYSGVTYGSGPGWYIQGSTGSWETQNQAAIYGILDPAAGAATQRIKGWVEYNAGEVPRD
jgi:hypothetical protein